MLARFRSQFWEICTDFSDDFILGLTAMTFLYPSLQAKLCFPVTHRGTGTLILSQLTTNQYSPGNCFRRSKLPFASSFTSPTGSAASQQGMCFALARYSATVASTTGKSLESVEVTCPQKGSTSDHVTPFSRDCANWTSRNNAIANLAFTACTPPSSSQNP